MMIMTLELFMHKCISIRYRGKRMRIDYFLVSQKLKDRIVSCEMHGHGIELDGKSDQVYHL